MNVKVASKPFIFERNFQSEIKINLSVIFGQKCHVCNTAWYFHYKIIYLVVIKWKLQWQERLELNFYKLG